MRIRGSQYRTMGINWLMWPDLRETNRNNVRRCCCRGMGAAGEVNRPPGCHAQNTLAVLPSVNHTSSLALM